MTTATVTDTPFVVSPAVAQELTHRPDRLTRLMAAIAASGHTIGCFIASVIRTPILSPEALLEDFENGDGERLSVSGGRQKRCRCRMIESLYQLGVVGRVPFAEPGQLAHAGLYFSNAYSRGVSSKP
jgi:hypothetical protein